MKLTAICLTVGLATVAMTGCTRITNNELPLEQMAALETRITDETKLRQALGREVAALRAELDLTGEANRRLEGEVRALKTAAPKGVSLEEVRAEIKAQMAAAPGAAPTVEEPAKVETAPQRPEGAKPDEAAAIENARKLELARADLSIRHNARAAVDVLYATDKKTRADYIAALKKMVAEKPEDKYLRLALAEALTSTFQDIAPGIEQGKLAYAIAEHADKALELDKEFYDAVHFLAIFHAHYPPGFPEFKKAGGELDRALAMQEKLVWEDYFASIYLSYAQWLSAQDKKEEALAKVNAGLNKDPRNEQLAAMKKELEK